MADDAGPPCPDRIFTNAVGPDGHDIAHSASVLIDRDGVVRWTFVTRNFRVRPTPADVLAAIDALPAAR